MKCLECNEEMKCVNDVNYTTIRIDFLKCEKCGATADVAYTNAIPQRKDVVTWRKGE